MRSGGKLIGAWFLLLAAASGATAWSASLPNVVVFISDDHGFLDSSLFDSPDVRTPNLERVAAAGMELTHAYCASPTCAPSRAAILTAMSPSHSGAMVNHQPPRRDVKKWPAYFRELGYETAAIGKVAHYEQVEQYGFDYASHFKFHDDACVDAAIEWLEHRQSDKPLCLIVGTNFPHVPWPENGSAFDAAKLHLPPTHVDTPETRKYRAMYYAAVERMDADLGKVYDAAYRVLGPNTIFVTFSDHGAQWPFAKWDCYEAGIRTPVLAAWPGKIEPGTESSAMVSLMDVLPTALELVGGATPTGLDGLSFAGVLKGTQTTAREKVFLTHSSDNLTNVYPIRAVRSKRWKYIRNLMPDAVHTTHIDQAKAVDGLEYWRSWLAKAKTDPAAAAVVDRYLRRPGEELYDLANDPYEIHDLARDERYAETLSALRADVDNWMAAQGDKGLETENEVREKFLPAEK